MHVMKKPLKSDQRSSRPKHSYTIWDAVGLFDGLASEHCSINLAKPDGAPLTTLGLNPEQMSLISCLKISQ